MLTRRRFLQVGLAGAAVLGAVAVLRRPEPTPRSGSLALKMLDADGAALIAALAPAILAGALPDEAISRGIAISEVVDAFDRALAGLSPAVQEELLQLVTLLTFAPSRALVGGVWQSWDQVSPEAAAAFLERWRNSRFDLLRAGYQALKQLLQAGWYGNPLAWGKIGFALPASSKDIL